MTTVLRWLAGLSLLATAAQAQPGPLPQWHHLDPAADHAMGISTERAYALLRQLGRPPAARPVLVAVIDGGTYCWYTPPATTIITSTAPSNTLLPASSTASPSPT